MELPIFSDNLRSSTSWTSALEPESGAWRKALIESSENIEPVVRRLQLQEAMKMSEHQIDQGRLHKAASLISSWAAEVEAKLNVERLVETHRALVGSSPSQDVLRKTEALPINAAHDPTPAILLSRMLDNAFDWFTTASFNELHPVEQATVVYLRLLDLHPFPSHTETTALLGASFYTERAKLPPLIIFADQATLAKYQYSLDAAFRMLTQPLVEFFAEMLTRTIQTGLGAAR